MRKLYKIEYLHTSESISTLNCYTREIHDHFLIANCVSVEFADLTPQYSQSELISSVSLSKSNMEDNVCEALIEPLLDDTKHNIKITANPPSLD